MANNIDAIKILGSLLNSGAVSKGSSANILSSVLGELMGGGQSQGQSSGGGLGGLGAALSSSGGGASPMGASGLGGLLGAALKQYTQGQDSSAPQAPAPSVPQPKVNQPEQMGIVVEYQDEVGQQAANDQATLMIRAMVNAAKSDGQFDQQEQQNILGKLGEVTQDEINFIQQELSQLLDVNAFARSVPNGLQQQVYSVSLMAIDLDSNPEAQYLHGLAQGLGIQPAVCNQIHQQLGAPVLYR